MSSVPPASKSVRYERMSSWLSLRHVLRGVMTRDYFTRQMARMSGLRFVPRELDTHWEGLHALPESVLERAIGRAIVTRSEFPTPRELREDADACGVIEELAEDRTVPLAEPITVTVPQLPAPLHLTHVWRYACERCEDTGWAESQGQDGYRRVQRCPCVAHNPEIRRRRQRQAKWAEQRASRGTA